MQGQTETLRTLSWTLQTQPKKMDWTRAISRMRGFTFMVKVDADHIGTGFIVGGHDSTMAIVSAWHVIEPLYLSKDKFRRYIELHRATGGTIVKANAVGVSRIGIAEFDLGMVWVGPPMASDIVDSVLVACVKSQVHNGIVDVSGGGGILEVIAPPEYGLSDANASLEYLRESNLRPNETILGWIGYPTDALSNESGTVRVVSDTEIILSNPSTPGMSGGPVFDRDGRLAGVMSGYYDTSNEAFAIPISSIRKMYGIEQYGFPNGSLHA